MCFTQLSLSVLSKSNVVRKKQYIQCYNGFVLNIDFNFIGVKFHNDHSFVLMYMHVTTNAWSLRNIFLLMSLISKSSQHFHFFVEKEMPTLRPWSQIVQGCNQYTIEAANYLSFS